MRIFSGVKRQLVADPLRYVMSGAVSDALTIARKALGCDPRKAPSAYGVGNGDMTRLGRSQGSVS